MLFKRATKVAGAIFRLLFLSLLALLAFGCVFAVILTAVVFYRSAQGVASRDVESLVKPVADLKAIWGDKGDLSVVQGVLEEKNQEIKTAAANLDSIDRKLVSSNLQMISANLSFLEEKLRNERSKAAETVRDLETKVKVLNKKVGPPATPEKIVEVLFRETGAIFAALLWPLFLATLFFYLLRSKHAPERLRALLGGFKSLKLGLAEIVLNDSERTKARSEDTFAVLREQAKLQYDLSVQKRDIRQKLEQVVEGMDQYLKSNGTQLKDYRCTLHVPDIVLADTLYQLLDYLPTGTGRGRVFSVRFGVIGKVWRRFKAETQGQVIGEEQLIKEWGMTLEEAKRATRDRPSFLCVPLKYGKEGHVGIFYMDSKMTDAFRILSKQDEDLHNAIVEKCEEAGLDEALAKMKTELIGRAPLIRVYER